MKALLLVPDVAHAFTRDFLNPRDHAAGAADLAADDHAVGGGKGFAGDAGIGVFG